MVDEPSHTADEFGRVFEALFGDNSRFDDVLAMVADSFVQHDRRKMIGGPALGKAELAQVLMFFTSEAGLDSRHRERLVVRDDRLTLTRVTDRHRDGSVREFLVLADFGGDPVQLQRTVLFDPDDVGAALAELDRLQADIEVNDS